MTAQAPLIRPAPQLRGFIGIDPGKKGAIFALCGDSWRYLLADKGDRRYQVQPKGAPSPEAISDALDYITLWLRSKGGKVADVWLERQWGRPTDVPTNAATLGQEYGMWRMALHLRGYSFETPTPKGWRKAAGIVPPAQPPLLKIEGESKQARLKRARPRSRRGREAVKAATIAHVQEQLPGLRLILPRCSKAHDGLADAAGMALGARLVRGPVFGGVA